MRGTESVKASYVISVMGMLTGVGMKGKHEIFGSVSLDSYRNVDVGNLEALRSDHFDN